MINDLRYRGIVFYAFLINIDANRECEEDEKEKCNIGSMESPCHYGWMRRGGYIVQRSHVCG